MELKLQELKSEYFLYKIYKIRDQRCWGERGGGKVQACVVEYFYT